MSLERFNELERDFFGAATAIVTGGTSGVGLVTACRLADAGVRKIVLVGRDASRGAAAVDALEASTGYRAEFRAADLLVPAQAEKIVADTLDQWGRIDILVNSMNGSHGPKLLSRMSIDDIAPAVINQMMGVLHMCKAASDSMKEQGAGVIVNVASDAAKSPTPGESAIGAAMAGIVMFTRTIAMELKRNGIRVNVVTPSIIKGTGGFERVMKDDFTSRLFEKAITMAHLGVVEVDDMAELITFLCSPRSAKLTGQAISLNGGISAH